MSARDSRCHMSHVTCQHMSHVSACHMSHVSTCLKHGGSGISIRVQCGDQISDSLDMIISERWLLSLKVAMIKICFKFLKCDRPAIYVMWSNEMMTEATSFMVCTGVQQYLLMAGHLLLLLTAPWTIYVSLDFCAQVFKLKTNYLPHSQLFCSVKLRCMKKAILFWCGRHAQCFDSSISGKNNTLFTQNMFPPPNLPGKSKIKGFSIGWAPKK